MLPFPLGKSTCWYTSSKVGTGRYQAMVVFSLLVPRLSCSNSSVLLFSPVSLLIITAAPKVLLLVLLVCFCCLLLSCLSLVRLLPLRRILPQFFHTT
ncbi:hypothetical protein BDF14DRAFT_1802844, partial [Spinellus fusiger]